MVNAVETSSPLLALTGIQQRYANGTMALVDGNLSILPGEVHGLLGANGAGKSTMVSVISGALVPTGGRVLWRGEEKRWPSPLAARRAGIATLYQHPALAPTLSARENILLGEAGFWRRDRAGDARVDAICDALGLPFDPDALVSDLPMAAQQMVCVAQALNSGAGLILMDEPTAALNARERAAVHRTIRHLARDQGKSVVLVSHFLDEILALTDRVTVLRDGRDVLTADTASLDERQLAGAIANRPPPVHTITPLTAPHVAKGRLLTVEGLRAGGVGPLDLSLAPGEVLGMAGLLGSGRSTLLNAIFGARDDTTGTIMLDGKPVDEGIGGAMMAGLALIPEDRKKRGFIGAFSIAENIALPPSPGRWRIDRKAEAEAADAAIAQLGIRAEGPHVAGDALSGGNAQKMVIAKWLRPQTRVLLLDEPTAGMDVGARADVLGHIRALADQGLGVIMVSSDFDELLTHCTRILVLRGGRFVAQTMPGQHDKADLLMLASTTSDPEGIRDER